MQHHQPKVSVIIATYNDAQYLGTALASLEKQTLEDFDVVVVNDGSTDNTEAVVDLYAHPRLVYLKHEKNQGLPSACNTGLAAVRTPYFLRLDADDTLEPNALECLLAAMNDKTDLVFSDRWENDRYVRLSSLPRMYPAYIARTIQHFIACGVLLRTNLARLVSGYKTTFWEETDFYIRYLTHSPAPIAYVPKALYRYTIRQDSMTKGIGTIANLANGTSLDMEPYLKGLSSDVDEVHIYGESGVPHKEWFKKTEGLWKKET